MATEAGANVPPIKVYPDKYANQVVLVTGAAQGIGETTARLFASQGATVILVDVQESKLVKVKESIEANGGTATYQVCNLTEDAAVNSMIASAIESQGKIDVLVHLAGIYPFIPLTDMSAVDYHRVMAINMDACFYLTRAVLPHMRKAGYGRIINTSSGTVHMPGAGLSAYISAKSAIVGFTRSTATEAGPGITANVVMPGLIRTQTAWDIHTKDASTKGAFQGQEEGINLFDMLLEHQSVKRHGRPEDVAHAVSFIASPEAEFITGQIFDVGGGLVFH